MYREEELATKHVRVCIKGQDFTRRELPLGELAQTAEAIYQHLLDLASSGVPVGKKPRICLMIVEGHAGHVERQLPRAKRDRVSLLQELLWHLLQQEEQASRFRVADTMFSAIQSTA